MSNSIGAQSAKLSSSFRRLDAQAIRACHSVRLVARQKINDDVQLGKLRAMFDEEAKAPEGNSVRKRILQWTGIAAVFAISTSLFMM